MDSPVISSQKENHFESAASDQKIVKVVGRDFNKSIANITGLVELLKDSDGADPDYKKICYYLSVEAKQLNTLVHDVCA